MSTIDERPVLAALQEEVEAERDRYRENYEALAVETGAILSRYREALEEIRGADPVDLALDPTWAQRIAEGALNEEAADDAPR